MFGLFKEKRSALQVAGVVNLGAEKFAERAVAELEVVFKNDGGFLFELFALSYALGIIGVQQSKFSRKGKHLICVHFATVFPKPIAEKLGIAGGSKEFELWNVIQRRYEEYRVDHSDAGLVARFLKNLKREDLHPSLKPVLEPLVHEGWSAVKRAMDVFAAKATVQ
jgi:hypothetical protein